MTEYVIASIDPLGGWFFYSQSRRLKKRPPVAFTFIRGQRVRLNTDPLPFTHEEVFSPSHEAAIPFSSVDRAQSAIVSISPAIRAGWQPFVATLDRKSGVFIEVPATGRPADDQPASVGRLHGSAKPRSQT